MNSFIGISNAHTTNLAVVAPGIAEALLATPLGLTAAIPAVVIYNMFARLIAGYRAGLGGAAAEVLRLVSRDLERAAAVPAEGATERASDRPVASGLQMRVQHREGRHKRAIPLLRGTAPAGSAWIGSSGVLPSILRPASRAASTVQPLSSIAASAAVQPT
jgi:MotA/TolQ/ExbB proton channel family